MNDVRFTDTTMHLEPDSVILRDPAGKAHFQILDQNYRADPISQALLPHVPTRRTSAVWPCARG